MALMDNDDPMREDGTSALNDPMDDDVRTDETGLADDESSDTM